MGLFLLVATFICAIIILASVIIIYWETIKSQFATLPSDNSQIRTARRFEHTWIHSYLPNTSSVLHVSGTAPMMINIQTKLVESQKEKHILLNSDIDTLDELVYVKDKHSLQTELIHGKLADVGKPVSFISRSYATTDYYGNTRESIEKHQEYTLAQLENLHGIKFDAAIFETQFDTITEIESFLKQLSIPAVFFMFRMKRGAVLDRQKFNEMLSQYHLQLSEHHRGTWLCLAAPPHSENATHAEE